MRMMMRAEMCTKKANAAVMDGTLGETIDKILEMMKPEAAYFIADEGGHRTAYFIIDMKETSQIPSFAELWFLALEAKVTFFPVMLPEDVRKAGPGFERAVKLIK